MKRKRRKRGIEYSYDKKRVKELEVVGAKYSLENSIKHNNRAVNKIREQLKLAKIPFEEEKPIVVKYSTVFKDSKLYILDFYLPPPMNIIIEIDGGYHTTKDQRKYDRTRDNILKLKETGETIRITNDEVLAMDFQIMSHIKARFRRKINRELEKLNAQVREDLMPLVNDFLSAKTTKRKNVFFSHFDSMFSEKFPLGYSRNKAGTKFTLIVNHKGGKMKLFTYDPRTDSAYDWCQKITRKDCHKWVLSYLDYQEK